MTLYTYKTDSESGIIEAGTFEDAIRQLEAMVPLQAIADGAWGWVEDQDGYRYEVGSE